MRAGEKQEEKKEKKAKGAEEKKILFSNLFEYSPDPLKTDLTYQKYYYMTVSTAPKVLRKEMTKDNIMKIITTDVFSLLYLWNYNLRYSNPHPILEAVRKVLESPDVEEKLRAVRKYTVLDARASRLMMYIVLNELKKVNTEDSSSVAQAMKMGIEKGSALAQGGMFEELMEQQQRELLGEMGEGSSSSSSKDSGQGPDKGTGAGFLEFLDSMRSVYSVKKLSTILKYSDIVLANKQKAGKEGYKIGIAYTSNISEVLNVPKNFVDDDIFYMKMVSGGLLKKEKIPDIGGYYVLLDKSGSMSEDKLILACSIAYGLALHAKRNHINFYMRFFDSEVHKLWNGASLELLSYILSVVGNGGTDITKAIRTAAEDLKKASKKHVIVVITDAEDDVSTDVKLYGHKLVAIVAGNYKHNTLKKLIRKVGGSYYNISSSTEEEVLELVQEF